MNHQTGLMGTSKTIASLLFWLTIFLSTSGCLYLEPLPDTAQEQVNDAVNHGLIDTVVTLFVNTNGGSAWMTSEIIYNRIMRILRKQ